MAFPMILRPILQARSACSLPFVDRAEQNMATGIDSFRYRFRYRNFTSLDFQTSQSYYIHKIPVQYMNIAIYLVSIKFERLNKRLLDPIKDIYDKRTLPFSDHSLA